MQDWLQAARNLAEKNFQSLPFPTVKDENFRFTPLHFPVAHAEENVPAVVPEAVAAADAGESVLLLLTGEAAELHGKAEAFHFTDLVSAVRSASEFASARLRNAEEIFQDDKFAQLTAARWKNGAFLHVPAGVRVEKPIRFVSAPTTNDEHARHLIVLEEGAEAVVIQESWSDESPRFFGELVEVKLGRNSKLHWIVLQQLGVATEAVIRQHIEVQEGAELRFTPLHLGGKLVQVRQETHLAGAGSSLETQGAARGDQQQHFDFWLDVRHESARSRSNMDYWFVMAGKSKGVFNGQVEVKQNAPDCESSQRSKSLLLDSGSVHSIPKLIIKTDAVKCSHGASVSSVGFEQLHYLQTRGIPLAQAERMIVRGFTEVVLERMPTENLRVRAEALLDIKQGGAYD